MKYLVPGVTRFCLDTALHLILLQPPAKVPNTDMIISDTVAATLSFLLYELCKNLETQAKLRTAIDEIETKKAHLNVEDVTECAYLDGVINETLRLHPAVSIHPRRPSLTSLTHSDTLRSAARDTT